MKDNIDVARMPTTAACPDFTYVAEADAAVVARLREMGAICLGKTNLDQFATGLVGVRTPYPVPRNAVDPELVPGGSSSGSAVAVARGLAAFALGTDTAGSGRVPAALNDIVGLKPSLGALSSIGMVPACRSLDTISIFAASVAEAWELFELTAFYDAADPWSRELPKQRLSPLPAAVRIAVPDDVTLRTHGDEAQAAHFRATVEKLRAGGAEVREIDFTPFYAVAEMLYSGPWVAERIAAVGTRLAQAPETLHPTTRAILGPGLALTAVDAFKGLYRLQELKRRCEEALGDAAFICVPTIPTFVTLEEIGADPDRAECAARHLHQFRQPARSVRHRRADRPAWRWPPRQPDHPGAQGRGCALRRAGPAGRARRAGGRLPPGRSGRTRSRSPSAARIWKACRSITS